MHRRPIVAFLLTALGLSTVGCVPKTTIRPAYYGPTDSLATVVEKLNANNSRLTKLWSKGTFSANLIDPQTKKSDGGDGDLNLLYEQPGNLRIVGRHPVLVDPVFNIGSNAERYWLVLPQQDVMYWGNHAGQGRGVSRLPVRPDLLVEVLCVTPMPTDLLAEPAPALRFNNDQDCYMLTWNVVLRDRFAVQKEVWYDRQTLQPRLVLLFDTNGRIVLRAYPSEPKEVAGYDPPVTMPSKFDLLFPESGSTFNIRLRELEKERDDAPNELTFTFPDKNRAKVSKEEQLDR